MAVNLSPIWGAGAQLLDNSGNVLSGGKIYTYAASTTTPAATYTSSNGLTANSNPIILNSAGRVPYEIWLTNGISYKFVLKDSNDTLIATYDNLYGISKDADALIYNPDSTSLLYPGPTYVGTALNDITNEASGSSFVGFVQNQSTSVSRTVESKLRETISVKDFGAVGDGVTDDTSAFQAAANDCDNNKNSYIFVPNYSENYYINQTVSVINPGIQIFGQAGATYDRGTGKNGNILIGSGATYAFNLGASRTTGNPADNWTVKNIKFKQAAGVTARTKYGIAFTSKTNGPDRGAIVRECSATGLAAAVYVPDLSVDTRLANLIVENCCFSNNGYAVYAPNANVLGARIVGNQMEQNTNGAIHGSFQAGVVIADNMLEGQSNAINITVPSITGNRPIVVIERNYFESNTGNYIIQYRTSAKGHLIVKDNYNYNSTATDAIRVLGGGVYIESNNKAFPSNFPVTFTENESLVLYGSNFLVSGYYKVRQVKVSTGRAVQAVISDYQNLVDSEGLNTHVTFSSGTQYQTPYGLKYCVSGSGFVNIPMAVNDGDVFTINVLCKQGTESVETQLWNASTTSKLWEGNAVPLELYDQWALVSITGRANQTTSSLRFRFYGASATSLIAGVAARNYGAHVNDGTDVKSIYPVVPDL